MTELTRFIQAEIAAGGPMNFERFMELALYHPQHGYYRRERVTPRTGRAGDFFTSVSVGPLFGRLLARQFFEMWEKMGRLSSFWIIEQGAEDGQLACDILGWCRETAPEFFAAIRYGLVESSSPLGSRQEAKLREEGLAEKVSWFSDLAALADEEPHGVFFSNELVDAFPVRRVVYQEGMWRESCVTIEGEGLGWTSRPIQEENLSEAVRKLPLPSIEGYATEISLRGRKWMAELAGALKRGYIVTVDYGFPASIYYASFRLDGTLTAYRNHRRGEEILLDPGGQDLTAHVDFSALAGEGDAAGWATLGFVDQQHFLMGVAHDELSETEGAGVGITKNLRAWQTLIHPEYFGTRFQVLVQAKDVSGSLAGLRYARAVGLN